MLVLSRKANQSIKIGDNIEVTVLGVSGGRVRLGISAPEHVRILRSELDFFEGSSEPEVLSQTPPKGVSNEENQLLSLVR